MLSPDVYIITRRRKKKKEKEKEGEGDEVDGEEEEEEKEEEENELVFFPLRVQQPFLYRALILSLWQLFYQLSFSAFLCSPLSLSLSVHLTALSLLIRKLLFWFYLYKR